MKYPDPSRRELLKTLAGAAAILPASGLIAQTKKGAGRPRRIDVHHHMLPPFQANMTARKYTPQVSLDEMDKFGTESAVLSLTVAAEYLYDGTDKAIKFARELDSSKAYAGALYQYLEAVRHFGMLDPDVSDEAKQAALRSSITAGLPLSTAPVS